CKDREMGGLGGGFKLSKAGGFDVMCLNFNNPLVFGALRGSITRGQAISRDELSKSATIYHIGHSSRRPM
ncbi:MAG: hypothetical protein J5I98_31995, partial [Phaeodactylibacter sp.]|nr:hypothetical protein [Phaeodactylibacter sp.]